MNKIFILAGTLLISAAARADKPALTIYNENFAVVRDSIHLDLAAGLNHVSYTDATRFLEPDSVVLRDPTGKSALQILEQNYRADPVSQRLLLDYYVGKSIEFESPPEGAEGKTKIVMGKIIRSGYVPQQSGSFFGRPTPSSDTEPIIEVGGQLMFELPGRPRFPALPDDSILKPTLTWQLNADNGGTFDAEISYITGGMSWEAAYNLVAPEKGDQLDLVGWVTIVNHTGKRFNEARIKLMAGNVNKIRNAPESMMLGVRGFAKAAPAAVPVTEKAFDEYHLYTLERPATLLDEETKQVEFVRANGIQSRPIYVYDGAKIDPNRYYGWGMENIRSDRDYGTQSNPKVWVMREFMNAESNHLGMPLPKGRMRFYRRDADGQLEFIGEDTIDHTPRDEKIRVNMGNAFDLVGERKRTDHHLDDSRRELDESFAIKLRNHKKEPAEIRVVEHLYRWPTWEITAKSTDYTKTDAQTIEFHLNLKPDEEQTVTYTVHYSW